MRPINKKFRFVILNIILTLLIGCNGNSKQSYYKIFADGKISESLEEEYIKKYSDKWKDYGYKKKYSLEQLFAREDYISINEYYKQQTSNWNVGSKDRNSKEYCVHLLSYFIPLNFWNLRFNDEQYVKKAIKDIDKKNKIKGMKYIEIDNYGIGTPIYSNFCVIISGVVF